MTTILAGPNVPVARLVRSLPASGKVVMKLTYVIGDIHGCYREFKQLLDLCSDVADGKPASIITFGDYVARGPDSFGVVQLIRYRLAGEYPVFKSNINLKGNHEEMMVQGVLGGELSEKQNWLSSNNGGDATVEIYPNKNVLLDDVKWLVGLPPSCGRAALLRARGYPARHPAERAKRCGQAVDSRLVFEA
jgi:hypothetical protein